MNTAVTRKTKLKVSLKKKYTFLGSNDLPLFVFKKIKYCKKNNITDAYQGILVEVFMERPLMGNILTQFLPTLMFLIIR